MTGLLDGLSLQLRTTSSIRVVQNYSLCTYLLVSPPSVLFPLGNMVCSEVGQTSQQPAAYQRLNCCPEQQAEFLPTFLDM